MKNPFNISRKLTIALIVFAAAILGLVLGYHILHHPPGGLSTLEEAANPNIDSAPQERSTVSKAEPSEPEAKTLREVAPVLATEAQGDPAIGSDTLNAECIAEAREIVARWEQIDLSRGALTSEQATDLRQSIKQLASHGAAALPAIREFLEKNQDLDLTELNGGRAGSYPSLRVGVLDALRQIGGSEAVAVSRQVLATTADPLEIAIVARNLEEAAPGQYRQDVLNAARDTLAQVADGKLAVRDVAPIFKLFQDYADARVVTDLEKVAPKWNYYATMALAELPDGQGIPTLIRQAQEAMKPGSANNPIALEMLAQVSAQYPAASAALIEEARQNRFTDRTWQRIASGLAGDQYQLGRQVLDDGIAPIDTVPGLTTFHIEAGNQNFYRTPLPANWTEEEINQRRGLIDQLLAVNNSPAAVNALERARAKLAAKSGGN